MSSRPGCVTFYIVILVIGSLFITNFMILHPRFNVSAMHGDGFLKAFTVKDILLVNVILNIPIVLGLWFMKRWAMWLVVIINSIGLLNGAYNIYTNTQMMEQARPILMAVVVLQLFVIIYFLKIREDFD